VTGALVGDVPGWAAHPIFAFNLMQHSDGFDAVHYVGRHVEPICAKRHSGYDYVATDEPVDCSECLRLLGGHARLANLIKQLVIELTMLEHSVETLRYALALRGGGGGK